MLIVTVITKQELDKLDESNNVYKLVGPVLVKQDLIEAKQNVHKRIEYIENEMYVYQCIHTALTFIITLCKVLINLILQN